MYWSTTMKGGSSAASIRHAPLTTSPISGERSSRRRDLQGLDSIHLGDPPPPASTSNPHPFPLRRGRMKGVNASKFGRILAYGLAATAIVVLLGALAMRRFLSPSEVLASSTDGVEVLVQAKPEFPYVEG